MRKRQDAPQTKKEELKSAILIDEFSVYTALIRTKTS
jgi:hypothetical protein